MKFRNHEHRMFYRQMLDAPNSVNDGYHRGLFYMLGLLPETRRNICELYDHERGAIRPGGLVQPWQTAGSIRVTRMAFHLFNGFNGFNGERQIEPESLYTPDKLFDPSICEYCLEGRRLRYEHIPRYERHMANDDFEDSDFNFNLAID